jgi:hypothetical protein
MRVPAFLACIGLVTILLAGCSGGGGDTPPATGGPSSGPLKSGKGAISGLLINDVFRPVPGGLVLIQELGLTATSDASGQFGFVDLEPGSYLLRVQAEGHEAAPQNVDVKEGEYSEIELMARRVFSEGGRIVTTEYSMFISCSADYVINGGIIPCLGDLSGDSDRAGFTSNYTGYSNATYLVTEMKANKADRYEVQVRCETEDEYLYYSVAQFEGDYVKMVMKLGEADREHEAVASYGENLVWTNDCDLVTILFTDSQFREELQDNGVPVCCGVGVHVGIKAKFVQSLFIGEPEVDIASYSVLA